MIVKGILIVTIKGILFVTPKGILIMITKGIGFQDLNLDMEMQV
jgi:hypothetical protein